MVVATVVRSWGGGPPSSPLPRDGGRRVQAVRRSTSPQLRRDTDLPRTAAATWNWGPMVVRLASLDVTAWVLRVPLRTLRRSERSQPTGHRPSRDTRPGMPPRTSSTDQLAGPDSGSALCSSRRELMSSLVHTLPRVPFNRAAAEVHLGTELRWVRPSQASRATWFGVGIGRRLPQTRIRWRHPQPMATPRGCGPQSTVPASPHRSGSG